MSDVVNLLVYVGIPEDCDKEANISMCLKVAIEKRRRLDPHDDPIHDQSTYLDANQSRRLYDGVEGYAIIQCSGDTVFIPN